jgi:FAD/FMN-containing dehydrogenase
MGGTLVDLSELNRVIRIDGDSITVQAGITLADLADELGHKGLEPIGGFDLANRTVGGAVNSAGLETSGGLSGGPFATHATQLKIVTADGRKLKISAAQDQLLALMRLSYGLLGIVYEVTLKVRPIQPFTIKTSSISFSDFEQHAVTLMGADAGLRLRLLPFRDRILCEFRESASNGTAGTKMAWRLKSWSVNSALPRAAFALAKMVPIGQLRYPLVDTLTQATQTLAGTRLMSAGNTGIEQNSQSGIRRARWFNFSTWAFPQPRFAEIVNEFMQFSYEHFERTGYRCDMPAHSYRMTRDTSALLAPSFNGPIMTISPMSTERRGWQDYAFDFAEFAMRRGGIPMFSLSAHLPREYAAQCYGNRLEFFGRMRRQFDPENRLMNQFFANFFGD